jgi:hypothetical protein
MSFRAVHFVHYRFVKCTARRRKNDGTYTTDALQANWETRSLHPKRRLAEEPRKVPAIEDTVDANGRLLEQQPAYDRIINAEVQLQLRRQLS